MQTKRFQKLLDRFGYKTKAVASIIDGKVTKRCDILSVHSHGQWIMTIPSRMYQYRSKWNLDLGRRPQLNYKMSKQMLLNKRYAQK